MDRERLIDEIPVLIVGAGPAGLTAAVTLARHGIESLVVERRPDLSSLPRAPAVIGGTMGLVRSWGLEEAVREGGVGAEWRMWECETLSRASGGTALPGGFPSPEQSAVVSPARAAC